MQDRILSFHFFLLFTYSSIQKLDICRNNTDDVRVTAQKKNRRILLIRRKVTIVCTIDFLQAYSELS